MNHYIQQYIDQCRRDALPDSKYPVCEDLLLLCDIVEEEFNSGKIYVDEEQLEKYLSYQKYFPYKLFPWEIFVFALHNCTYKMPGVLRWPQLFLYVTRGTGKNGYLAFEDFCLVTKTNGIREYNIDIFAMAEKQARTTFDDIKSVLDANEAKMKKHFHWTKEKITNTDTNSYIAFNTSSPKTKDGFRPGKIDFDEVHAYQDTKLMSVATGGLGKKPMPRRTYITTDGIVYEGVLDNMLDTAKAVLRGEKKDNGRLYFLCHIESEEEIHDRRCWHKGNPSLRYLPDLMQEYETEYQDYLDDPISNAEFVIKRLNWKLKQTEANITIWENVLATNQPLEDNYNGSTGYAGIDYASTTDFVGVGILVPREDGVHWIHHTFVCRQSRDWKRIKAPLEEWEAKGLITIVDAPEIPADLIVSWLRIAEQEYRVSIKSIAIDKYRYQLMRNVLESFGFVWDKNFGNIHLIRPSTEMEVAPVITSRFVNQVIHAGDDPCFRWQIWNSKMEISKAGNMTYGKIEPKSRKTDTFKAYVAAECAYMLSGDDPEIDTEFTSEVGEFGVMTF